MALQRFDAPGRLDDLNDQELDQWSQWISGQLDEARDRVDPELRNYGPRPLFFNELSTTPGPDAVEKDIEWSAFPRIVAIGAPSARLRWSRADASRDRQDEYCEWSVDRDGSGKIKRVTFTSEGPEYWNFLAAVNPELTLQLYRQHVSPDVQASDLFDSAGDYVERNRWNNSTDGGAMHLIQRNNTLGAEIELAAGATIVRKRGGSILTAEGDLIRCGRYGQPERHSDPKIGAEVNALARQEARISLANPVGLCIAGFFPDLNTWATPDGSDPRDYWRITRGAPDKALRAVYEVPQEKGFTVSDIEINGDPIEFGAQIVDFIRIKLTGLAFGFGTAPSEPLGCLERVQPGVLSVAPAAPSVASVLGARRTPSR